MWLREFAGARAEVRKAWVKQAQPSALGMGAYRWCGKRTQTHAHAYTNNIHALFFPQSCTSCTSEKSNTHTHKHNHRQTHNTKQMQPPEGTEPVSVQHRQAEGELYSRQLAVAHEPWRGRLMVGLSTRRGNPDAKLLFLCLGAGGGGWGSLAHLQKQGPCCLPLGVWGTNGFH